MSCANLRAALYSRHDVSVVILYTHTSSPQGWLNRRVESCCRCDPYLPDLAIDWGIIVFVCLEANSFPQ